ncbi:MAG: SDR family oxidoreductase [Terracidiphilus sp.]
MATILVTGGNIGNQVAEELAQLGFAVRVLTKTVKQNPMWDKLKIEQIAVDMASIPSMLPAFEGFDRFFSVTPFVENLAELGLNTIEAAKQAGVRRIVRSSFIGASETGITLGRDHRTIEKAVEASGIQYTILRPNIFMQSYAMNAESIRRDSAFYMPQGSGRVSLIDVGDVSSVAVAVLMQDGHENRVYKLTGPEALSNDDVAERLSRVIGKKVTYIDVTEKQAEQSMASEGLPTWMIKSLLELFDFSKRGAAELISTDSEYLLNRKPISFDIFVRGNAKLFQ